MDPQTVSLVTHAVQALSATTQALAWHAALQTYLLLGLAAVTVLGFWGISRDLRALGRLVTHLEERD